MLLYKTFRSFLVKRKLESLTHPVLTGPKRQSIFRNDLSVLKCKIPCLLNSLLYTFFHFPVSPTTLLIKFKKLETLSVSSPTEAVFMQCYFFTMSLESSPFQNKTQILLHIPPATTSTAHVFNNCRST